jgi:transmembrane 9 superfamily protein 2/4
MMWQGALMCVAMLLTQTQAFYLPGVAPRDYKQGEEVKVKVVQLSSTKTQLPYEYYLLDFCKPEADPSVQAENLGEVLQGHRILLSPYKMSMRTNATEQIVCRKKYTPEQLKEFKKFIAEEYRVNMICDNLPLAVKVEDPEGVTALKYEKGYALGMKGAKMAQDQEEPLYLNNHLRFKILYHNEDDESLGSRIVGFEVEPFSIKHEYDGTWNDKNPPKLKTWISDDANARRPEFLSADQEEVIWTYDILWVESQIKWASRWDTYLYMADDQIHWFSILNSLMIVLFLAGLVAMIIMRTLHNDFRRYEQMEASEEEAQEETGWKLVHGDVFRPPQAAGWLSVLVGTGVQVFLSTIILLIFALLGFLSPANRGALLSAMCFLFVFMGIFGGYSAARLYKMFKLTSWKKNTIHTAFLFPGLIFGIFFILNLIIWGERSSGAVPFGTLFALLCMWFGISVPLCFLGSYFGTRAPPIEHPVRTNQIPRQVPQQAWYMQPAVSVLIGGILPFGAVFVELFFILSSLWLHQVYYIFGFLFIVFMILVITCAEITIVMCYFQLCSEDYHWWWRSYLTSGSCALYLFLYSIFYYVTRLELTRVTSGILFFGYMLIISIAFFVFTGAVGFYSCFLFVRKIYGSVKVD